MNGQVTAGDIRQRLAALREPICPFGLINALHGLDLGRAQEVRAQYETWARNNRRARFLCQNETIHRFVFETFLQSVRALPFRTAAVQLGMDEDSLRATLHELKTRQMLINRVDPDNDLLVDGRLIEQFHRLFPATARMTFMDHNGYCHRLHEAIAHSLECRVTPLYCATSRVLHPDHPSYAYEFDALTGEPLAIAYQFWLDLPKPINLKPDATSAKTLFRHRRLIEPQLFAEVGDRLTRAELAKLAPAAGKSRDVVHQS